MALVKNESKETNKHELEIFVEADIFDNACNWAYRKNIKRINVPGFRNGKAPRKMVERRYGESVFFEEAIERVYPEALSGAIKEANLDVVAVEELEPVKISCKDGLTLKAVCITKPEVEIDGYMGIKVNKPVKKIDAKEEQNKLDSMRERNGRLVAVEDRAAEKDDTVEIDFEGFVDGKPFEGGKAENYSLKLNSGQFIPGFEDQIVGKKPGDEFDVTVTFPKDYHEESLKGKPAVFKCKLHKIQVLELPEADDEFAKDVSEFDTLKELKEDIRKKLEEEADNAANAAVETSLTDALIENMKAEIPEVMFEKRIDSILRDFEQRLSMQGLSMDVYMQYTGTNKESIRNQFREQAQRQVKTRLALEKISKLENIEVTEKDIEDEYKKLADTYKMEVEQLKKSVSAEDIKSDLAVDKAMRLVKEQAAVTEVDENEKDEKSAKLKANPKAAKKSVSSNKVVKSATSTKKASAKSASSTKTIAKETAKSSVKPKKKTAASTKTAAKKTKEEK